MKSEKSLTYILFVLGSIEFSFFWLFIFFLSLNNIEVESSYIQPIIWVNNRNSNILIPLKKVESKKNKLNQNTKVVPINKIDNELRLEIPSINVDANIKSVGLTKEGIMDTPNNADDVWLFALGKRPGEKGSAVIAGHYGVWKNGKVSVFNKLNKLKKGDKLHIWDEKWEIISFVVRESKIYDLKADASEVFISDDGKSHLNLITCVLDKKTKKYSKRLVIFTDKI